MIRSSCHAFVPGQRLCALHEERTVTPASNRSILARQPCAVKYHAKHAEIAETVNDAPPFQAERPDTGVDTAPTFCAVVRGTDRCVKGMLGRKAAPAGTLEGVHHAHTASAAAARCRSVLFRGSLRGAHTCSESQRPCSVRRYRVRWGAASARQTSIQRRSQPTGRSTRNPNALLLPVTLLRHWTFKIVA